MAGLYVVWACRVCGASLAGSWSGCAVGVVPVCRCRVSGYGIRLACPACPVVIIRACSRVCPGMRKGRGHVWCPLPFKVLVRRRATLPHPSGCSTIAVPGLSFRVRNGSGRLPWAMAAANLVLYIPRNRVSTCSLGGSWWVGDRIVDATEGLIHVTCRVSPCRPSDALVCSCHPLTGRVCVLPFDC